MKTSGRFRHGFAAAIVSAALLASGGIGTSRQAVAGDREWATAGKILTGVVIAEVLNRGILCPPVRPERVVRRRVTVIEEPVVVHRTRVVESCSIERVPSWSYRRRYHDGWYSHRPSWGHHRRKYYYSYPKVRPHVGPCASDEAIGAVVLQADKHRRLCQPAVHGHPALIQKRPFPGHPWVTVGTHPSIW